MLLRARSLCLVALVPAVLIACGSSSSAPSTTSANAPALDGTYTLDAADSTFAFDEITFIDDTRYMIDPTGCNDGDLCKKQGWYTSDGSTITLHDDGTDDVTTLPFSILASEPADTADETAVSDGDDGGSDVDAAMDGTGDDGASSASGDDGGLIEKSVNRTTHLDTQLVSNSGSLTSAPVASKLLVSGKSMTRVKGLYIPSGTALVGEHLDFEGSCAFLRGCSVPSQGAAAGTVHWGCGGTACSDTEHWMAVPKSKSASLCGKTITICVGTNCQTALVRDVSNANAFEGSEGLLSSLKLPYGGQCVNGRVTGGFGGGLVKMKF